MNIIYSINKAYVHISNYGINNFFNRVYRYIKREMVIWNIKSKKINKQHLNIQYRDFIKKKGIKNKYNISIDPKISIVVPVYNPPLKYLKKCIESVQKQEYENWELCMYDDGSEKNIIDYLLSIDNKKIKVKIGKINKNISVATNSAIDISVGDYILFLDHDDELTATALSEVVLKIEEENYPDIIYSDHDKLDMDETLVDPNFKPGYSPQLLLSGNYITHLVVAKKNIVDKVGGLREGYEGSQDYDFLLRAEEVSKKIIHIPKILYHWRKIPNSFASVMELDKLPDVYKNGQKAVQEALLRRGINGKVTINNGHLGHYRVSYNITKKDLISVISIIRDTDNIKKIIDSFKMNVGSNDVEFIFITNDHSDILDMENVKILRSKDDINASEKYNIAVQDAKGKYIHFIDEKIKLKNSLDNLISILQQKDIGVVGGKVLKGKNIYHAGIILGLHGKYGFAFEDYPNILDAYMLFPHINRNVSAVSKDVLSIKKKDFITIGGFDKKYSESCYDIDLCLRLENNGLKNVYIPNMKYSVNKNKKEIINLKDWKILKKAYLEEIKNDYYYNINLSKRYSNFPLNM